MPNTYTQLHIQYVFAVRYRKALINNEWQEGFGAFSYSKSHVPRVVRYIKNQQKHHQKISFLDEYKNILDAFDVEYDDRYLFHRPE